MKWCFILILLLTQMFYQKTFAQSLNRINYEAPWSISFQAGPSHYFGELYSLWKYNDRLQPGYNVGVSNRYTFGTNLKIRGDISIYQISGDDKYADTRSSRIERNQNFLARNLEFASIIEYYLKSVKMINPNRQFWNPYVFLGIGLSSNNPHGKYHNQWIPLRPLNTENNFYRKTFFTFPLGVGVKYKINLHTDLFAEMNYRFTSSDYLDDLSSYNISEFYMDLIHDYRPYTDHNGNIVGGDNPMRLRMAIRNPNFILDNGEPDVEKIIQNRGQIRRGSGLAVRKDGFMTMNVGIEIYLAPLMREKWTSGSKVTR